MSISLNIRGTIINFPSSGASPLWSSAVIQFAQETEAALRLAIGTYDVSPQTYTIDAYNTGTDIAIPNLSFDPVNVRGASIVITTNRSESAGPTQVSQLSEIGIVYNASNPSNNKWEIAQRQIGDASITFSITDAGQVLFTTTSIGAGTHLGELSYSAKALENS